MPQGSSRVRAQRIALAVGACALVVVVVWLDVATGVWEDLVIISGIAAGLLMFFLTVLVLDRVMARNAARRWAPVTRIAYSEFLHVLADEETSDISLGEIVARSLPAVNTESPGTEAPTGELEHLRRLVVDERNRLANVLSRWAPFLASSGENEKVLGRIGSIAWQLDVVRDASLEAERDWSEVTRSRLHQEVKSANGHLAALVEELTAGLHR